jgi:tetratricopeptide (TPR) repeat protein
VRCESVDSARRIEAGCLLVEILAESGSVLEGAEVLRELNQLKATSDDLAAKRLLAAAQLSKASGDFERSSTALERTIALLERKGAARTTDADNMLARAYISLASCRHVDGNVQSAIALSAAASAFLDQHPWLAPDVSAQILSQLGMAHATTLPGGADVAATYLSRAYAITERHALAQEAADIAIGIANVHVQRREFDKALENGWWGLSLSENLHGPMEHAWRCANVAWVAFQAGKPAITIELARRAAALGPPPVCRGLAKAMESSALLKSGDTMGARSAIGSAIALLRGVGNHQWLGSALRINAEVNYSLRCLDEARTSIEEAIDLLSRYGYPGDHVPSMRIQAKILGNGFGAV